MVGYHKRFDPAYLKARQEVRSLRDLRYVEVTVLHPEDAAYRTHHVVLPLSDRPWSPTPEPAINQAILAEASLSYLGLGVQEPVAAWGLMLQGGAEEYATTAPWIAVFPGLAIVFTVLGISLFGDALRDAIDPKLRDR